MNNDTSTATPEEPDVDDDDETQDEEATQATPTPPAAEEPAAPAEAPVVTDRIAKAVRVAEALQVSPIPSTEAGYQLSFVGGGEDATVKTVQCALEVWRDSDTRNLHREKSQKFLLLTNADEHIVGMAQMDKEQQLAGFSKRNDLVPPDVNSAHIVLTIRPDGTRMQILQVPRRSDQPSVLHPIIMAMFNKVMKDGEQSLNLGDILGTRALIHDARSVHGQIIVIVAP